MTASLKLSFYPRKKFYPESFKNSNGFESIYSPDWHTLKFETYTIKQKTISSASYREFGHFKLDTLIEKESRKSAVILFFSVSFLVRVFYPCLEITNTYQAQRSARPTQIFVKNEKPKAEKPKVEKIAEPKLESAPKSVKTAATNENLPSDKVFPKLRECLKMLILAEFLACYLRFQPRDKNQKNIIISSGVTAGSGESGESPSILRKDRKK